MRRICFYSDDSYLSLRGRKRWQTVIAGAAVEMDRSNVRNLLLQAEKVSRKGLLDWYRTGERARQHYIEGVLDIPGIAARIFFTGFDSLRPRDIRSARLETLTAAIAIYTPGRDCHHRMAHEGLQSAPRRQLRIDLQNKGCHGITVESAQFISDPEIRLADALAGYIRGELFRDGEGRATLTNLPDQFVDLGPKMRNPPDCSGG